MGVKGKCPVYCRHAQIFCADLKDLAGLARVPPRPLRSVIFAHRHDSCFVPVDQPGGNSFRERDNAARRPVSRVLSAPKCGTTIRLGRASRRASRDQPGRRSGNAPAPCGATVPIRSCSRWGLPCRTRCLMRGALLPHRFALARGTPCGSCAGGVFSVALSLRSPSPAVNRHRLPVEPGLSSNPRARPRGQRPSGRLADNKWAPRQSRVKRLVPAQSCDTARPVEPRMQRWPVTECHPLR